jgi:hypothetical protein
MEGKSVCVYLGVRVMKGCFLSTFSPFRMMPSKLEIKTTAHVNPHEESSALSVIFVIGLLSYILPAFVSSSLFSVGIFLCIPFKIFIDYLKRKEPLEIIWFTSLVLGGLYIISECFVIVTLYADFHFYSINIGSLLCIMHFTREICNL